MDSLFDDKPYEVGDEIEAYCPNARCRGDTTQIIRGMYENEIRRVECTVCGDLHGYRKPRGIPYDDAVPAGPSLKKRSAKFKKPSWEEAMAKVTEQELASCRPYSTLDNYELLDVVSHPIFEIGFITELLPDNKVEITFKDKSRILVHRKQGGDFASKISELPAPRSTKRKKRRKQKGPSELAQRLLSERMLARAGTKNFEEVAEAKEELAERAAVENRRLALEIVARKLEKGIELTETEQKAAKDARKLARDEERRRKAEEKERIRLEREKEREKQRLQRDKEREKERKKREKEKEREKRAREREKERERRAKVREREQREKERQRERVRKEREREKRTAEREREKLRREKERERARKRKLAESQRKKREADRKRKAVERAHSTKAKKSAAIRRTGGKKTTASIRRTGGKKTIPRR